MAAKASAQITLHYVIDIKATYRYYLLQSSTAAKPSKPTTNPPSSSWDDVEPSYTEGSTNSLYYVDCTVFSDGTFSYSDVSLSTSYEAAKQAYNKAVNAQNTANNAQNDIDNLEIGGRNLLPDSEKEIETTRFTGIEVYDILSDYVGREITISFDAVILEGGTSRMLMVYAYQDSGISIADPYYFTPTSEWTRFHFTTTVKDWGMPSDTTTPGTIGFYDTVGSNNYAIRRIKIELGNKPTDYTVAPEDITSDYTNQIINVVNETTTTIQKTKDDITLEVSEKYYTRDDTDSLIGEVSTTLTQTAESFEMQFTNVNADLNTLAAETNDKFEETKKYIRFEDGKILLGAMGNQLELQITNDKISFLQAGAEVAYFSNSKMYVTDGEYLNSLRIGKFAFVPRANGSLDFKKVGD